MSPAPENSVPETTPEAGGLFSSWILEVPPQPAYISTARLFAGAMARHFGVADEMVDDLKLAVSEACTGAIRIRETEGAKRPVRIEVDPNVDSLVLQIEDAIEVGPSASGETTDDLTRGLSIELIRALFPDAEMLPGDRGTSIRLSLPLGEEQPEVPGA
jgi:Histidine kinase-like ATPase domain